MQFSHIAFQDSNVPGPGTGWLHDSLSLLPHCCAIRPDLVRGIGAITDQSTSRNQRLEKSHRLDECYTEHAANLTCGLQIIEDLLLPMKIGW